MTARQEVRVGTRRPTAAAWSIEAQRGPLVGTVLLTARARKGVDLARAERDTKIRAKHLMALENGDYGDLPAPVYTKGFLRNYAQYLGLDPDEMLARWRRELDVPRAADRPSLMPPPQPIANPRRGLKFTPGLLVAVALTLVVAGFAGYVVMQLVRFSQNPEITLTGPSVRWLAPGAGSMVLAGTGTPRASVTVTGGNELVRTTDANEAGHWSVEVPVAKGRNDLIIVATDPETGRQTPPLPVIATVPVDVERTPAPRTTPTTPTGNGALASPSRQVLLVAPVEGATIRQGRLRVEGTSDAESAMVSFDWLGKAKAEPKAPEPRALPVIDGIFRGSFALPPGRWQVNVESEVGQGEVPAVASRKVGSVYSDMVVTVEAVDGYTRVSVTADGRVVGEAIRLGPGERETYQASEEIVVHVGNAQAAHVTVDGVPYGPMGKHAKPVTWVIEPGQEPRPGA